MARGLLSDYLLSHNFHLLDVDWSMNIPPFVLWPSAGFSSISAPELTIETEEITEGTSSFKHHVLKKASVGSITLSRGATMFNSDFWRWIMACLKGTRTKTNMLEFMKDLGKATAFQGNIPVPGKRRNLALIHLSDISVEGLKLAAQQGNAMDKLKALGALPAAGLTSQLDVVKAATGGMVDFGIASVPAKVWMLFNCLPVRYKPASDFDAGTSAVSIQELEIACERFEEFALLA